ncbi:MAG: glycosyltransferase, partial [Actinomycetota bacterium]|nr:glycosyltransferase [Actinomycetota bacterium]
TRDSRVLKQARSFHEAGYEVWCVGIVAHSDQPLREELDCGVLVRVPTTSKLATAQVGANGADQAAPDVFSTVYGGALGSLRHFLGRVRENAKVYARLREIAPDFVLVNDPNAGIAGLLLRTFGRTPFGYDSRELWLEVRSDTHWLFRLLWAAVERRLIRRAAFCTTVNDEIARELERRYKVSGVRTVYNGAIECVECAPELGQPVQLLFQGSFARDRNLDTLVRAMSHLNTPAVLNLQGYGAMQTALEQIVVEQELQEKVRFVPACEPSGVARCAAQYDVGVICHLPVSLNHRLAAPNKLFDYMAGGLAIAGSDLPVISQILRESECGGVIDPRTPESLAASLDTLISDRERLRVMKLAATHACYRYSWAVQGRVFTDLADAALQNKELPCRS